MQSLRPSAVAKLSRRSAAEERWRFPSDQEPTEGLSFGRVLERRSRIASARTVETVSKRQDHWPCLHRRPTWLFSMLRCRPYPRRPLQSVTETHRHSWLVRGVRQEFERRLHGVPPLGRSNPLDLT